VIPLSTINVNESTQKADEDVSVSYYLLLELVPSTLHEPLLFRRIGIMQFPKRLLPPMQFKRKTITIT
jgi:hypothetical protein